MPKRETLLSCEIEVDMIGDKVVLCGKPATARWTWNDGKTWLYVCEEHDEEVSYDEE